MTRCIWDRTARDGRGDWVPAHEYRRAAQAQRIHVIGAPEPFQSMADGKFYTSKAKYRAELRARGFEEVGNERREFDPRPYQPTTGFADDFKRVMSERGLL